MMPCLAAKNAGYGVRPGTVVAWWAASSRAGRAHMDNALKVLEKVQPVDEILPLP
jgi:hypothetical protein